MGCPRQGRSRGLSVPAITSYPSDLTAALAGWIPRPSAVASTIAVRQTCFSAVAVRRDGFQPVTVDIVEKLRPGGLARNLQPRLVERLNHCCARRLGPESLFRELDSLGVFQHNRSAAVTSTTIPGRMSQTRTPSSRRHPSRDSSFTSLAP
jgi:hypothetical protein